LRPRLICAGRSNMIRRLRHPVSLLLTLLTVGAIAALSIFGAIVAQQPPEDEPTVGEDPAPSAPVEGLNPARALPNGSEPNWWRRASMPSLDIREKVLANGMKVLVLKSGDLPVVATNLWYHVGSAEEPTGLSGVAHYL